ncbi:glycosyltransferase family 4 protein [archaeon]|nr:glycosyltransferase family 4 protein [archaeon]
MRLLMLTWEFPPRIVGGIARHCWGLARALAHRLDAVHVVTLEFPDAAPVENLNTNLTIHRIRVEIGHPGFLQWTLLFNHFMAKYSLMLSRKEQFDLVHAHDWLCFLSGIELKHALNIPLIVTFHSTEFGRAGGLHHPDSYAIHGIEWWGAFESRYVITTSNQMRKEVCSVFQLPEQKVRIIPNGIDVSRVLRGCDPQKALQRVGVPLSASVVLFVGRLVHQKGVEYLVRAFPKILRENPDAWLVIVGDGPLRSRLEDLSKELQISHSVRFTGFIPDELLAGLLHAAAVLVVPSVYEPFGIVALEGMAAGTPVVVSKVGGLAEIVEHEQSGLWVYPEDSESIAWGVCRVLSDPDLRTRLIRGGLKRVQEFTWEAVADQTYKVYQEALQ